MAKKKVALLMGSDSDLPRLESCIAQLVYPMSRAMEKEPGSAAFVVEHLSIVRPGSHMRTATVFTIYKYISNFG